jgi:hypothetical protein
MDEDFDNEVGFWIKNIPYLWSKGDTILTSKRFYLLKEHGLELYDENNNLTDVRSRQNIKSVDKKRLSTSKETFSLIPTEGKKRSFIRNYFLVWTFSNGERDGKPILYKKYKDKKGNSKNRFNSWVDTADIRIEGVRYKRLEPEFPRKFRGSSMTILDCKECMKNNNTRIIPLYGYEIDYSKSNKELQHSNSSLEKKCIVSRSMESIIQETFYYQDRNKKWPFSLPTKTSYNLLCRLSNFVERLFSLNTEIIKRDYPDRDIKKIIHEGKNIYNNKPFKNKNKITWSQNEYDHPGFHRAYIRYKSIQRFTETWELLRRAHNLGILASIYRNPKPRTIRVASLAGGPGFELYALKEFFNRYYPHLKVECISLDLAESWRPYAEELGLEFDFWNVDDGKGLPKKLKGKIDFAIVSYALHMYMSKPIHINWLSKAILNNTIPILFVNSCIPNLKHHITEMKNKGISETDLILPNQKGKKDNRQIVYYNSTLKIKIPRGILTTMFPNVPYE